MEHLGEELDDRRLVGILLAELHGELEGAVLEGGVVRPEDDGVPHHDVVLARSAGDAGRRVFLQTLEIAHETSSGGGRHCVDQKGASKKTSRGS